MMNILNVGSQESIGVKYIDDIYTKLFLKLWFESNWYFCTNNYLFWYQAFDSLDILISAEVRLILGTFKLHQEN